MVRKWNTAIGSVSCPGISSPWAGFRAFGEWEGSRKRVNSGRGSWEKRWREGHLFPLLPELWQRVRMVKVEERGSESPAKPRWGTVLFLPGSGSHQVFIRGVEAHGDCPTPAFGWTGRFQERPRADLTRADAVSAYSWGWGEPTPGAESGSGCSAEEFHSIQTTIIDSVPAAGLKDRHQMTTFIQNSPLSLVGSYRCKKPSQGKL